MNIGQRTIGNSLNRNHTFLFSDDYFLRSSAEFVHQRMTILSNDFFSRWWFRVAPKSGLRSKTYWIHTERAKKACMNHISWSWIVNFCHLFFFLSRLRLWRMSQCTVGTTKIKKSREKTANVPTWAHLSCESLVETFASLLCVLMFFSFMILCVVFWLRAVFYTILKQISWCHVVSHIFSDVYAIAWRSVVHCVRVATFFAHFLHDSTHSACMWSCRRIYFTLSQWQKRHTNCSSRVNDCNGLLFVI